MSIFSSVHIKQVQLNTERHEVCLVLQDTLVSRNWTLWHVSLLDQAVVTIHAKVPIILKLSHKFVKELHTIHNIGAINIQKGYKTIVEYNLI